MITRRIPQRRVRMLNYRATPADDALLALVAGRLRRSRSDTLRLLVRAAAAELDGGGGEVDAGRGRA